MKVPAGYRRKLSEQSERDQQLRQDLRRRGLYLPPGERNRRFRELLAQRLRESREAGDRVELDF